MSQFSGCLKVEPSWAGRRIAVEWPYLTPQCCSRIVHPGLSVDGEKPVSQFGIRLKLPEWISQLECGPATLPHLGSRDLGSPSRSHKRQVGLAAQQTGADCFEVR